MMYLCLIERHRLATSDVSGLYLYDVSDRGAPIELTRVEQPGALPFFSGDPAGEAMVVSNGLIVRSFTPEHAETHWTRTPTHVGIYQCADLSLHASLGLLRLDHKTLALSPDGAIIASVDRGAGAIAFDAKSGERLWRLPGSIASGASFSPDGRWLALGETGQGGGQLTLIDTQAPGEPTKQVLEPPTSRAPLYDAPFLSAFTRDGQRVVFTSMAWGLGGVAVYDVQSQSEVWSSCFDSVMDEDEEFWDAPILQITGDDRLVLVGQEGQLQAYHLNTGEALPTMHLEADSARFAVDSDNTGVWVTRDRVPVWIALPEAWLG